MAYTYGDGQWRDLLTNFDGQTITTDRIGNMLSDGTWTYTWEHGRQLASMWGGGITWTFTYNSDGMRTQKTDGDTVYRYTYNGSMLTQLDIDSNRLFFVYDASSPIAVVYINITYYYVTNLQGDVTAILNSSGTPVVRYTYDAWGNPLTISGTMSATLGEHNPLRYRGYVYDTETGLYYLQSRYYDPEMGRFINADAYASTGQGLLGNTMFAYCGNNPVKYYDPSGKLFTDWDLSPNMEAGKELAEWYINTDENETDSNGNLTTHAKIKCTIISIAQSIEFELGIGLGLYAGVSAYDVINANAGVYYDLIRIQYIDGQFMVCQYAYLGFDVGTLQIISFPASEEKIMPYSTFQWEEVNEDERYNLWGGGAYFFAGGTCELNWDLLGLFNSLVALWEN